MLTYKATGRLPTATLIFPNVELRLDVATSRGLLAAAPVLVSPVAGRRDQGRHHRDGDGEHDEGHDEQQDQHVCGGALAGFSKEGSPIEALLAGAVSASFCVEGLGLAGLFAATREKADARTAALRQRIVL